MDGGSFLKSAGGHRGMREETEWHPYRPVGIISTDNMPIYWNRPLESLRKCVLAWSQRRYRGACEGKKQGRSEKRGERKREEEEEKKKKNGGGERVPATVTLTSLSREVCLHVFHQTIISAYFCIFTG